MSFLCRHVTVHFADFLIFVTFRTKAIKVTTSNTKNLMGILAFILQILKVLVYWTMSFLRRHFTVLFCDFLILVTSKPRFSKSQLQTQGTSRVFQHLSYRHIKFWFIGRCPSFADMLQYISTTSSYLLPLKPRFSRSLL